MHFRLSVRCLLGVCWVSGGCQGPSGLCLRCINAKSIGKGLVDIILNKYRIFSQWPIFGQKRLDGPNFQRGVVGHFPAFLAIFFGLYGQVMDLRTYWGVVKKNSDRTHLSPYPNTIILILTIISINILGGGCEKNSDRTHLSPHPNCVQN